MPAQYRVRSREDAVVAIPAWLGGRWQAFKTDRRIRRDSQQLRRQPIGTLSFYFNWGERDAELGLRLTTRDATWPQRPVPLKSRTGLLIQKRAANSIMVSLCKGDADCFWAFESPDVEEASSGDRKSVV